MRFEAYLRPWKLTDAPFIVKLRNTPDLRQYFRQEHDLTLREQIAFMLKAKSLNYIGYIMVADGKNVGVLALHGSELCVAAPLKYHEQGVNILKAMYPSTMFFGDVFVYNPALPIYLSKCGFEAISVKEKYCKKAGEWVGAIKICSI